MPRKPCRPKTDRGALVPVRFGLPAAVYDYLKHCTSPRYPTVSALLRARILGEFEEEAQRFLSQERSASLRGTDARRKAAPGAVRSTPQEAEAQTLPEYIQELYPKRSQFELLKNPYVIYDGAP